MEIKWKLKHYPGELLDTPDYIPSQKPFLMFKSMTITNNSGNSIVDVNEYDMDQGQLPNKYNDSNDENVSSLRWDRTLKA